MARILSLLFVLQPILLVTFANDLKLHQLNVIFRHGDRMPECFPDRFPNDPNMLCNFYPMGTGGLTNQGKMRVYQLGKHLREKYGDFLGKDYEEERLFAIASDLGRTKMSLSLLLAGLYPPSISTHGKWNDDLDWQPIPFTYKEFNRDPIFPRDKCEMFIEEYNKAYNSAEAQKELEKYKTYAEELTAAAGKSSPLTMNDINLLHNNLDVEKRLNLTMKPWMLRVLENEKLVEMRKLIYKLRGYTPKLRRLGGGYLLRKLNEDMAKAVNKTAGYKDKVFLYSGHDATIIFLLQALELYDSHFPEFGSALIFELLSQEEKYFVKISYHLGIPQKTIDMVIPGCETLCPLEKYLSLTKSAEILDEERHCVIKTESYYTKND